MLLKLIKNQVKDDEFHEWKANYALKKSQSKNISLAELAKRYDYRQQAYGKLLTLLFVPLLIPLLWIVSLLVKKFNPGNHFTAYDLGIASLEINLIILFGFYLVSGIVTWLATRIYGSETVVLIIFILFLVSILFLLLSFFRRAYAMKWWQSFICVAILVIGYMYLWNLYSLIAFLAFI